MELGDLRLVFLLDHLYLLVVLFFITHYLLNQLL